MSGDLEKFHATIENSLRGIFPGIKKVIVSSGSEYYPAEAGLTRIMERVNGLSQGELLFESDTDKLLIVRHDYGDDLAAVYYEGAIEPADISRFIRLMFAGRCMREYNAFVPAAQVEEITKRWEKRIAILFGREFAYRLVERSLKGKNMSALTHDDLEGSRAFIASAIGDCLFLQKVHK